MAIDILFNRDIWEQLAEKLGWDGSAETLSEVLTGWQNLGPSHAENDNGEHVLIFDFRLRASALGDKIPETNQHQHIEIKE